MAAAERVERVRAGFEHFARTARPSGLFGTAYVWNMGTFKGWTEQAEYHGPEEMLRFQAMWAEPYDDWQVELEDLREAPGERIVMIARQRGRLRGTDSWVALRFGLVYVFEGDDLTRIDVYATAEEALDAAGIGGGAAP